MGGYYIIHPENGRLTRYSGWGNDFVTWLGGNVKPGTPHVSPSQYFKSTYPDLNLTDEMWDSLIERFYETNQKSPTATNGMGNEAWIVDTEGIERDIQAMLNALADRPDEPLQENFLNAARAQIAEENEEMYRDLDALKETSIGLYNDQLGGLAEDYSTARSNILSKQYQQNAQLMDTLQSGMDRSRRNALEAGASAGIRIADNINTLLSVQNKQSATSMETANQLSQMMINQRNAEAKVRGDYANMLENDTSKRHDIKLSSESRASSLADTNYQSAYNSYNKKYDDWSNANYNNPFFDHLKSKPKYDSNTGGN